MDDNTLAAELNKAQAKHLAAQSQKSRLDGKLEAIFEQMAADPYITDPLRAKAWLAAGHKGIRLVGDTLTGVPAGWPEGMDGSRIVEEFLEAQAAPFRDPAEPEGLKVTPSVAEFRKILDG